MCSFYGCFFPFIFGLEAGGVVVPIGRKIFWQMNENSSNDHRTYVSTFLGLQRNIIYFDSGDEWLGFAC